MATNNAIDTNIPIEIASGGTGDATLTAYAVLCGGTTSTGPIQSIAGLGTAGQVLTSNGAAALPTFQTGGGGSGIVTIDGDTGSATGATVTFSATSGCGTSVTFDATSSTVALNASDVGSNTFWGYGAGSGTAGTSNTSIGCFALNVLNGGSNNTCSGFTAGSSITTGVENDAHGWGTLGVLTTGNDNAAFGNLSLGYLGTGSRNISVGSRSGANYVGAESNNIIIGNAGIVSESNVIRIGTQGSGASQQNTCYIAGINGVTTSNSQMVTIDSSTGQLGAASIPGGSGFTWNFTASTTISAAVNNGYGITTGSLSTVTLPASVAQGTTIKVLNLGAGGFRIVYNTGQHVIFGTVNSTVTSGSLASTQIGDSVELLCTTANTTWAVLGAVGEITIS